MGIAVILTFVTLLLMNVPIFFVIASTCMMYFLLEGMSISMLVQRMFVGLDVFVILAIPLYILAGNLMSKGGILERLIAVPRALVDHIRGGLAHVNVVASIFFAGISGSAVADMAALGPLEIKMMTDSGYKKDFSTAVTMSSACIGPIIPPSINMVVYGVVASVSIGQMLLAGVFPGILLGLALMAYISFYTRRINLAVDPRAPFKVMVRAIIRGLGPLALPLIILGGIYSGVFTPTEAGAVACLYAFIIGKIVYRELKWKDLPGILLDTAKTTASVLAILAICNCFSWIVTLERIPDMFTRFLLSITTNQFLVLLIINLGLLLLGCFMETLAAIIITTPILLPVLGSFGMSPIQAGLVIIFNLTLGLLTPPIGINLFIGSSITKLSIGRLAIAVLPFYLISVVVLLAIMYIPDIAMFLPELYLRTR